MVDQSVSRGGVFIDQAEGGAADGLRDPVLGAEPMCQCGFPVAAFTTGQEYFVASVNECAQDIGDFGEIIDMVYLDFHAAK